MTNFHHESFNIGSIIDRSVKIFEKMPVKVKKTRRIKINGLLKMNLTKKFLRYYILTNYSIIGAFLFTSVILLNIHSGFSFLNNDMSSAGLQGVNPKGWIFFSLTMWYGAIVMFPLNFFFHSSIRYLGTKHAWCISFFFFTGSIGMFMVGLFPSSVSHLIHVVSAALAFGGYGFGILLYFFVALKRKMMAFLAPCIIFIAVVTGLIITQGHVIINGDADFDAFRGTFYSISLWEWIYFFCLVFVIISFTFIFASLRSDKNNGASVP
ncbi:MAG: hypothetical protein ACTSVI_03800 [Promethearchaeota archaeon]